MRDFIAFCTLLACIIIFVAAVIALFKPLPKLKLATKKDALIGLGIAFGLFIVTAIVIPSPDGESAEQDEIDLADGDTDQQPTLTVDLEAFSDRFDMFAEQADLPWRMERPSVEDGTFSHTINENLALIGNVGAKDRITQILLIGTGDGSVSSGIEVFMAMTVLYCTTSQAEDIKQCGPKVQRLLQSFEDGGTAVETKSDGVVYNYIRTPATGSMMTITPSVES